MFRGFYQLIKRYLNQGAPKTVLPSNRMNRCFVMLYEFGRGMLNFLPHKSRNVFPDSRNNYRKNFSVRPGDLQS